MIVLLFLLALVFSGDVLSAESKIKGTFKCRPGPGPLPSESSGLNPKVCPDGFIFFNKSCYYFSDKKLRHGDARSQCEGKTSQLVFIESREESDFLFNKIEMHNYWIGANGEPRPAGAEYKISASNVSQSLFWDDGTAVTYIDPFGDFGGNTFNHPDGCYVMFIVGGTKRWKDYDCQRPCRFVCEYKGQNKIKQCPKDVHIIKLKDGSWQPPLWSWENSTRALMHNAQLDSFDRYPVQSQDTFGNISMGSHHLIYRWDDNSSCSLRIFRECWKYINITPPQLQEPRDMYLLRKPQVTRNEAAAGCHFFNSHLISIDSINNGFNGSLFNYRRSFWMNAQYNESRGVGEEGGQETAPVNQASPSGGPCGVYNRTIGQWIATACNDKLSYICQRPYIPLEIGQCD